MVYSDDSTGPSDGDDTGTERAMYFQDGGYMVPRGKSTGITVLARYTNGSIVALVAPHGREKLGLCGPHPEAPVEWY